MLTKIIENVSGNIEQQVTLVSSRCLRNRNRASRCSKCAEGCPKMAIFFQPTVVIDHELCTGCLSCVAYCATEALVPKASTLGFRNATLHPDKRGVSLSCKNTPHVTSDIIVDCLAVLSVIDLAALVLRHDTVVLNLTACQSCPRAEAITFLVRRAKQITSISALTNGQGIRCVREVGELLISDNERRDFFEQ